MNRSIVSVLVGIGALVATPAFAQQPLQPAPTPMGQSTVDPYAQQPQPLPQAMPQQPMDPYSQYGEPDEEDDSMDVTYDISTTPPDGQEQQYDDGYDPNAYQQFESQLAPYGTWDDDPEYGHVWTPSSTEVGYDFEPYDSGGHFVYSDYGWTWASDYAWGSAPFHYGRWAYGGRGWCWVPGTVWGPGWVSWRWGGGYVGWAPMGPRGRVIGPPRGIRSPWRFTVAGQLGTARPHYLPSRAVASVWRGTSAVHNVGTLNVRGATVRYNAGPSSRMFAAATGRSLAATPLHMVAPRALPNGAITPRLGTPMMQRPWMRSQPLGGTYARTVPGSHVLGSTPVVSRPGSVSIGPRPVYNAPASFGRAAQPVYRAPQSVYRGPAAQPYRYGVAQPYHGMPAYHYNTPAQTYHAAPVYHYGGGGGGYGGGGSISVYRSTPTYSAPSSFHSSGGYSAPSGGFSGGGGYHGGGASTSFHSSGGGGGGSYHGGGGGSFHGGGGHR